MNRGKKLLGLLKDIVKTKSSNKNNLSLSEVYCDNKTLKDRIVDAKPSDSGLYLHEIIMINYSSFGSFKTVNTSFPNIFKYQLYVQEPNLLLESLIERDYIRICTQEELLKNLRLKDLRELMKFKGLKCKGTSSTEKTMNVIKDNCSISEIVSFYNFLYYVPTEKGNIVIKNNEHFIKNQYSGWNLSSGYAKDRYINPNDIKLYKKNVMNQKLYIDKINSKFRLTNGGKIESTINSWMKNFPKGTKLSIIVDGNMLCEDISVDEIYLMKNIKKITICKEDSNKLIYCTCYDYDKEVVDFKEKISSYFPSHKPKDQYHYSQMIRSFKGIITENLIHYYVSINNMLGFYILSESLKDSLIVEKLNCYLKDDSSFNYKISVDINDDYTRNIIMYMIINKMFGVPTIKGASMKIIMDILRSKSSSKVHQALMDDNLKLYDYEQTIANELEMKYPYKWDKIYDIFIETYPPRIFMYDTYKTYSSENMLKKDENYLKVWEEYDKWRNEFNNLVDKLKMEGIINPRWLNEFSLYVITDAFFPDAIYQYRVEWLGRQSLDIFIPSIDTGIEYQGKQHYEAIDFFGGEEGFIKVKQLDEKKKLLCQKNNIKLIEWAYTEEVNLTNYYKMLKYHKIAKVMGSDKKLKIYNETLEKNDIFKNYKG